MIARTRETDSKSRMPAPHTALQLPVGLIPLGLLFLRAKWRRASYERNGGGLPGGGRTATTITPILRPFYCLTVPW
jgi:hypothetical protein